MTGPRVTLQGCFCRRSLYPRRAGAWSGWTMPRFRGPSSIATRARAALMPWPWEARRTGTPSRVRLPFALLSDSTGAFSAPLRLPWFEVAGERLLKRLTLIIRQGRIAHCLYPVFPPDRDAETVLAWLRDQAT